VFEPPAPVLVSPDTSTSPEHRGSPAIVAMVLGIVCVGHDPQCVIERTLRVVAVGHAHAVESHAGRLHSAAV
jgi:hypothetical protein